MMNNHETSLYLASRGFLESFPPEDDATIRKTVVLVENATIGVVNGEYHFSGFKNDAGMFIRKAFHRGRDSKFVLFKHRTRNSNFFWFISVPPENKEIGTGDDEDIYHLEASSTEKLPNRLSFKLENDMVDFAFAISFFEIPVSTFHALYIDNSFHDFTLEYDKGPYGCHKCVLAAVSVYFQRMFANNWKDSSSFCTIEPLADVTTADFSSFLQYLYTNDRILLIEHEWAIWKLCDYFEVTPHVRAGVVSHLANTLTLETAERFIPIVNESLFEKRHYLFASDIQRKFVRFVVSNSILLANADFPFDQLEKPILKAIFQQKC
jgi:hypothetical protein